MATKKKKATKKTTKKGGRTAQQTKFKAAATRAKKSWRKGRETWAEAVGRELRNA